MRSELKRGKRGAVRGVPAERVQEVMAKAVAHIRTTSGDTFTRAWLRDFFANQEGVDPGAADAMVHSFWRTVHPVQVQYGQHRLPDFAEAAVAHRSWRLTSGQMSVVDCIQLHQLLASEKDLSPGLAEMRSRLDRALRALRVPQKLWKGG